VSAASPSHQGDDPWIRGYLTLRAAVLSGDLETPEEITAYATELRRGLPTGGPAPPIAAFIAADIKVTFPVMADLLWTPS